MCLVSPGARATLVLAALLLPVCALAEPLRLQLAPFASEVPATVKELQPRVLGERTRYGLKEALKKSPPGAFELLAANSDARADLFVSGKVVRQGARYRITYSLVTNGPNRVQSSLNYDFASPRLTPKGVVAMARDLLDEARKLSQAPAPAPAASASAASAAPASSTPPPPATPGAAPVTSPTAGTAPGATASTTPGATAPAAQRQSDELPTPQRSARTQSVPAATDPAEAPRSRPGSSDGSSEGGYVDAIPERSDSDSDGYGERRARHAGETHLDIGASGGFNSPAGTYGGELEYRPFSRLGVGVSGGRGALGARLGPLVRLYPFGHVVFSPFLEAGMSFNLGYTVDATDSSGNPEKLTYPLTYAATGCIGARIALGPYVYLTPRVGWAQPLKVPELKSPDGTPADIISQGIYALSLQAGFVASLSLGVSPF